MKCTVCGKESEKGAKVTITIFREKIFFYCSPACVKKSRHGIGIKQALLKMFEDHAISNTDFNSTTTSVGQCKMSTVTKLDEFATPCSSCKSMLG